MKDIIHKILNFKINSITEDLLFVSKAILNIELMMSDEKDLNDPIVILSRARKELFKAEYYINSTEEKQNLLETAMITIAQECLNFTDYYELEE